MFCRPGYRRNPALPIPPLFSLISIRHEIVRRRGVEGLHSTDAGEEAFRIHKTKLELRPVWHQTADRVRAHILVCFLAYVLRKTLEQWSERPCLGRSPRKLLQEIAQIKSGDVLLPTTDGFELRVRCAAKPEKALRLLLERLGLELPKRLRTVETMIPQTTQNVVKTSPPPSHNSFHINKNAHRTAEVGVENDCSLLPLPFYPHGRKNFPSVHRLVDGAKDRHIT